MLESVCIYASQLASCIGHNRFKKPNEALETIWQRVAPGSFRAALIRNGIKTQEEAVRDIMTSNQTVRNLLVHAEDALTSTSTEVARGYEDISQRLAEAELNWEERKLVDETMKKTMYTSYGTRQESVILEKLQARLPCQPDDTFYRAWLTEVDGVQVYVGGKIDAISDDRKTIVEIKNRINRLFYKLPAFEIMQVQAYLYLLQETESARLVECLTKDDGSVLMNVIPIDRDPELWDTIIIPKLTGFVRFLIKILEDPAAQDTYLQSRRRASMVTQALLAHNDSGRFGSQHPINHEPCQSQHQQYHAQSA